MIAIVMIMKVTLIKLMMTYDDDVETDVDSDYCSHGDNLDYNNDNNNIYIFIY